jgi:hypothetical protein
VQGKRFSSLYGCKIRAVSLDGRNKIAEEMKREILEEVKKVKQELAEKRTKN